MSGGNTIPQGRLARNTVLNLVGQALPLLVAVTTIPTIVTRLGPGRFGILSLAWVLVSYFAVFDLGLGRATTHRVAEALGAGEAKRIQRIVWTAVVVQAGLGILGALLLAGFTPTLVARVLRIPEGLAPEARSSFYVLALSVPAIGIAGSFRGVLEATQRFDLVNAVRVPFGTSNFVLPLLGVLFDWNLPEIVGLLVLSSALAAVAYWLLCTRVVPSLNAVPAFHQAEFRRLLGFGTWIMISSVLAPILVYLDRFMVARLLSIEAVAYYSAPYEMVTRLWIIPASLVATLFPAFSTLGARRETELFEILISRSMKYLLLVLGPIVIILYAFAHDVLDLWLGSAFADAGTAALQILCVGVLINSFAQVPYALIQALDRPDVTAKFHLLEVPLHVVLVWVLVSTMGIAGAALAWSLRVTVDAALLFGAARRFRALSVRSLVAYKIPQTVVVLGLLSCLTFAVASFVTAKWLQIGLLASLLGALGGSVWRYLLDEGDRARLSSLFQVAGTARSQ